MELPGREPPAAAGMEARMLREGDRAFTSKDVQFGSSFCDGAG